MGAMKLGGDTSDGPIGHSMATPQMRNMIAAFTLNPICQEGYKVKTLSPMKLNNAKSIK